jgi:hypothetical protein
VLSEFLVFCGGGIPAGAVENPGSHTTGEQADEPVTKNMSE